MKISRRASLLSGLTALTICFSTLAQAQVSPPASALYVCAGDPHNMIGLAPQFTVAMGSEISQIFYNAIGETGMQIELARTHLNEPPKFTLENGVYEIQAHFYNSEDARSAQTWTMSLDTKKLVLTLKTDAYKIPLPCVRK